MKKVFTLSIVLLCFFNLSAQTLQEFAGPRPVMGPSSSGADGTTLTCAADTVRYLGWKASGLRFLSVNAATSAQGLTQYYDCPQPLTVYGFEFHGYAETGVVNAICQLYLAGPDSLPIGSPLAIDTVAVDSTYGSLTLADLSRVATFASPVLMTQPFIIVYNNFTSVNTVMVCNDWDFLDGDSEWLGGGDFRNLGGDWTRSYDMNVGGAVYNADGLLNVIAEMENVSAFAADVTCLSGPSTVNFTDYCQPVFANRMYNQNVATGVPQNSYGWNFGDGSPVTFAVNPSHAYAGVGPYTTILYATLAGWTHTCIDNHSVVLGGSGEPIAGFTTIGSPGATIDFVNTSSGATSNFWNFGDGLTSTTAAPTHSYTSSGTFVVVLIVSNACGADTILNSVVVSCAFPDADFGYDQPSGTLLTAFSDSSSGDIVSYFWDFGDGWTSTLMNPYHSYPAYGDYVVTLIISGPCGNDTLVDTVHITTPVRSEIGIAADQLTVWPNPGTDFIQISGLVNGQGQITLADMKGRIILRKEKLMNQSGIEKIDINELPPGLYILIVEQDGSRVVKKWRKIKEITRTDIRQ